MLTMGQRSESQSFSLEEVLQACQEAGTAGNYLLSKGKSYKIMLVTLS